MEQKVSTHREKVGNVITRISSRFFAPHVPAGRYGSSSVRARERERERERDAGMISQMERYATIIMPDMISPKMLDAEVRCTTFFISDFSKVQ